MSAYLPSMSVPFCVSILGHDIEGRATGRSGLIEAMEFGRARETVTYDDLFGSGRPNTPPPEHLLAHAIFAKICDDPDIIEALTHTRLDREEAAADARY